MFIVNIHGNSPLGLYVYPISKFYVLLGYFCTKSVWLKTTQVWLFPPDTSSTGSFHPSKPYIHTQL